MERSLRVQNELVLSGGLPTVRALLGNVECAVDIARSPGLPPVRLLPVERQKEAGVASRHFEQCVNFTGASRNVRRSAFRFDPSQLLFRMRQCRFRSRNLRLAPITPARIQLVQLPPVRTLR